MLHNPDRRWPIALTLTIASLGSAITLAQLLGGRGGAPPTETLQIRAGDILEILPVPPSDNATYSWVLTQDRTFIEAGRNASYNTRLINPGRFTVNADVRLTTGQTFRRIFTIDVQPHASASPSAPEDRTIDSVITEPLVRTLPAQQHRGPIILAENQDTLLLTPLQDDLHPLNLDLDPANDSDSDGIPTNDTDNAETFFQTSGTPLYLWFVAPLEQRNITVHTTDVNGNPLTQTLPVLSAAFAKEHQPPPPLLERLRPPPPSPELPTEEPSSSLSPSARTILTILAIAAGLIALGFLAAWGFYALRRASHNVRRYLRQRKEAPLSPPPPSLPARVIAPSPPRPSPLPKPLPLRPVPPVPVQVPPPPPPPPPPQPSPPPTPIPPPPSPPPQPPVPAAPVPPPQPPPLAPFAPPIAPAPQAPAPVPTTAPRPPSVPVPPQPPLPVPAPPPTTPPPPPPTATAPVAAPSPTPPPPPVPPKILAPKAPPSPTPTPAPAPSQKQAPPSPPQTPPTAPSSPPRTAPPQKPARPPTPPPLKPTPPTTPLQQNIPPPPAPSPAPAPAAPPKQQMQPAPPPPKPTKESALTKPDIDRTIAIVQVENLTPKPPPSHPTSQR